jgi:hypothetical protein
MRSKTLIAAAVAGALSIPMASYATDMSTGVTGSVTSMSGPVQTQAGDLTFSQAQREDSSHLSASQPDSVTWYYPDGSVVHQQGLAFYSGDSTNASSGSSIDLSASSSGSELESEPSQVSWYYPDGSVFHQSGNDFYAEIPAESLDLMPIELASIDVGSNEGLGSQTWYFPDGSVMHQETVAVIELDEGSASTGSSSMSDFVTSSAGPEYLILDDSGSGSGDTWIIADLDPNFVIITE